MNQWEYTNRPGPHNIPTDVVLATRSGDVDRFVEHLTPYVTARSLKLGSKSNIDSDDFAQGIWLGLWVAARSFDPDRGNFGGLASSAVSHEVSEIRRGEFGFSINRTTADRVRKAVASTETRLAARDRALEMGIPSSSFDRAYQAFYTNAAVLPDCDERHTQILS